MRHRITGFGGAAGVAVLLASLLAGPAAYALPTDTDTSTSMPSGDPADAPTDAPVQGDATPSDDPTDPAVPAAPAAPVNQSIPVIDGNPVVNGTLSSTGGTWDSATSIQYSWSVNGAPVLNESQPAGTPSQLPLTADMAGKTVTLTVIASTDGAPDSAPADAATVTIAYGRFTNVAWTGTVTGTPTVGQNLSVAAPSWQAPIGSPAATTYQWYRGGAAIAGATGQSYSAGPADSGQNIQVNATISAAGYTSLTLASATVTVAPGVFTAAPVPTITGTAAVGQVQSANPGSWAPTGATLTYQWYRGTGAIAGATAAKYTATASDYGKALKVRVHAAKPGFTAVDKYSANRTIAAGTLAPTKTATITGTFRYGQTLRVAQGWSPAPGSIKYQWYRNGVAIKGGTLPSLYLNTGYIGAKVSVKTTVAKAGYATRSTITGAKVVGNGSIAVTSNPKITGAANPGSTLTASNGSYSPAPSSVGFQWYRNGAVISGAKNRSYKVAAADKGKSITVRVTAHKAYYDARVATSAAVSVPAPVVTVMKADGLYKVGTGIKPGLYKATGTGTKCTWARLKSFTGKAADLIDGHSGSARTYVQILASDKGFVTVGCGSWTTAPTTGAKSTSKIGDGTYRVGIDVMPGKYHLSGTGNQCVLELLSGFGGDFGSSVMDYYEGPVPVWLQIDVGDKAFRVQGCGTLTRF